MSIMNSRIKSFLNELEFSSEFSHTILHNFVRNKLKQQPARSGDKKGSVKEQEKLEVVEKEKAKSQKEIEGMKLSKEKEKEKSYFQKENNKNKLQDKDVKEGEKKISSSNELNSKLGSNILKDEKVKPIIQGNSHPKNFETKHIDSLLNKKLLFSNNIKNKDNNDIVFINKAKNVKEIYIIKTPDISSSKEEKK
jgi:hypothetical protein